jgi:hypothetical protein
MRRVPPRLTLEVERPEVGERLVPVRRPPGDGQRIVAGERRAEAKARRRAIAGVCGSLERLACGVVDEVRSRLWGSPGVRSAELASKIESPASAGSSE